MTTSGRSNFNSTGSDAGVELSPRAVRLAALLEGIDGSTVTLPVLWRLWAAADPASAGRPERRTALAEVLGQLTAAGLLTPSKTQDTTARPHLPSRVTLPLAVPSATASALARTVVWRPELAWVLRARLTLGQVEQLRRINTWLRDRGGDVDVLPLRERSLEVLGHEKLLDALVTTSVFGPERLTMEHLRTFRVHPPLPSVQVGDGPVALVVENDNTFHSIRTALATDPGPVGFVAWGAGGAFEASVRSCGDLPGVQRVRYFGDLDSVGLRIPRSAAATAELEGLPVVSPAHGLYRALLNTAVQQAEQPALTRQQAETLVEWLEDPHLMSEVSLLLQTGFRVPQEALTATRLGADLAWAISL